MAKGLRTHGLPDPRQWRYKAPMPVGRVAPFLLVPHPEDGTDLVLIAPFAKRRRGPTSDENAVVQAVAGHLRKIPVPDGSLWIDPRDGTATPAAIGEGQVRRRLIDNASFNVRRGGA